MKKLASYLVFLGALGFGGLSVYGSQCSDRVKLLMMALEYQPWKFPGDLIDKTPLKIQSYVAEILKRRSTYTTWVDPIMGNEWNDVMGLTIPTGRSEMERILEIQGLRPKFINGGQAPVMLIEGGDPLSFLSYLNHPFVTQIHSERRLVTHHTAFGDVTKDYGFDLYKAAQRFPGLVVDRHGIDVRPDPSSEVPYFPRWARENMLKFLKEQGAQGNMRKISLLCGWLDSNKKDPAEIQSFLNSLKAIGFNASAVLLDLEGVGDSDDALKGMLVSLDFPRGSRDDEKIPPVYESNESLAQAVETILMKPWFIAIAPNLIALKPNLSKIFADSDGVLTPENLMTTEKDPVVPVRGEIFLREIPDTGNTLQALSMLGFRWRTSFDPLTTPIQYDHGYSFEALPIGVDKASLLPSVSRIVIGRGL